MGRWYSVKFVKTEGETQMEGQKCCYQISFRVGGGKGDTVDFKDWNWVSVPV